MSTQLPPSDWQSSCKGIMERGLYLLETGDWSDCSFKVGTGENPPILKGHTLLLAMASPVFAAMFFGKVAETGPIEISDIQPRTFRALLKYIYTDKINLMSFDQACGLYYAAKKYILSHLEEECIKYLLSRLSAKNACRTYEFAKLFEEPVLRKKCLRIICDQTEKVLSYRNFDNVQLSTIVMILDQDELNIEEEKLFSTISRYATRHNQRPGSPSAECSSQVDQPTIRDAIMKIRFLTLSPQKFTNAAVDSNLLTESEKLTILMKICSPKLSILMPSGFSTSTVPRKKKSNESLPSRTWTSFEYGISE